MVNPIKNQSPSFARATPKKKAPKEVDVRVKKAVKKSKLPPLEKGAKRIQASSSIAAEKALLAAEKTAAAAKQKALIARKGVRAQKGAFLSQRAHMSQQAAAARRARAAEKAKKAAERAAKKAADLRRVTKIKAYLAKPEEKKRNNLFSTLRKKKNPLK